MAVDSSGNNFVTGWSVGTSGRDYLTIAYSNAGLPLWTNAYNGPANYNDEARAIATSSDGKVFVTGASWGNFTSYDCATVAYSSTGVPIWTNRYNWPGDGWDGGNAIAVDDDGNVFVTGGSVGTTPQSYDYATIAYSSAGMPLWTNRYNSAFPNAIAVDGNGNVFVTGNSSDQVTIAYSNLGGPLWTNLYNGSNQSWGVAIALDATGKVFVAGRSRRGANYDYTTFSYSSLGVPLWTNFYNGPANGHDQVAGMAVDGSGNVYVTGNSGGVGIGQDYATIAYSNTGVPLWTNRYNGPGNTNDAAAAIAVDNSGNVFVTGYSTISGTNSEMVTIAYSSAGVPLRTNYYGGFGSGTNQAKAIAVDNAGNVYVTGISEGLGSGLDYVTIKYPSVTAVTPIQLLRPEIVGGEFVFFLQTDVGRTYSVQMRTNLSTAQWGFVMPIVGDGTEKQINLPIVGDPEAYYRVELD